MDSYPEEHYPLLLSQTTLFVIYININLINSFWFSAIAKANENPITSKVIVTLAIIGLPLRNIVDKLWISINASSP